jgi:site-specific recombinase XerD
MGKIGDQMRQDLALAGYSRETQRMYWSDARALVRRFGKPPTEVGRDELRQYVDELCTSGVSPSRIKQHLASMKFLFEKTLGRAAEVSFLSWPTQPRPLARVLAPHQIVALLAALRSPKYRAIAMVMYGAGSARERGMCP